MLLVLGREPVRCQAMVLETTSLLPGSQHGNVYHTAAESIYLPTIGSGLYEEIQEILTTETQYNNRSLA